MKQNKNNVIEDSGLKAYINQQINEVENFLIDVNMNPLSDIEEFDDEDEELLVADEAAVELEAQEEGTAEEDGTRIVEVIVTVEKMDVKKTLKRLKKSEEVPEDFDAKFCYTMSVTTNDKTITAYGLDDNEFDTVKNAKEKLLTHLNAMAEESISTKDHLAEVDHYLSGNTNLH